MSCYDAARKAAEDDFAAFRDFDHSYEGESTSLETMSEAALTPALSPAGEGASPWWFGTAFGLQKMAERSRALVEVLGDVGKVFNATSGFANVGLPVWQHTIGGYQVLHRFLPGRHHPLAARLCRARRYAKADAVAAAKWKG